MRQEDQRSQLAFSLGPYHPALREPIWLQLQLEDETICSVAVTTGYCSRDIETLLTQRSFQEGLKLAERLCGNAAHHHRLAYCLALEQLAGVDVPPHARALRSLFCEIEMVLSHLAWAAHLAQVADLPCAHYFSIELRERLLEALEQSTGQRLLWGLPIPGGVAFEPEAQPLLEAIERLKPDLNRLKQQFAEDRRLQHQTRELAKRAPAQHGDKVLDWSLAAGDTAARIALRLREMVASALKAEELLGNISVGKLSEPFPEVLPPGEAEGSMEGPQGIEIWRVRSDGSDRPAEVKITTTSQRNLAAVPLALTGQHLRDALLIFASLDICVACVDK